MKKGFLIKCHAELVSASQKKEPLKQVQGGNNRAFTLAEVLITLTIIGVIAAITIPNLMQKHRKHEIEVGVKSAYSIIQNAIKMAISENGPVDSWDYSSTTVFTEKYIIPYLKVSKKCGMANGSANFLGSGCFHYDSSLTYSHNGTWFSLTGGNNQNHSRKYYNMKLQNGMDLGVYYTNETGYPKIYKPVSFVFDVNGSKGPTKMGVDVFVFSMDTATGKFWTGAEQAAWASNSSAKAVRETTYTGGCNTSANGQSGMACARLLEQNNWTFPDNYPIKNF